MTNSAYAKNNRVDLLYRLVFCGSRLVSTQENSPLDRTGQENLLCP